MFGGGRKREFPSSDEKLILAEEEIRLLIEQLESIRSEASEMARIIENDKVEIEQRAQEQQNLNSGIIKNKDTILDSKSMIEQYKEQIIVEEKKIQDMNLEIESLQNQIISLDELVVQISNRIENTEANRSSKGQNFRQLRHDLENQKKNLHKLAKKDRKKRGDGPTAGPIVSSPTENFDSFYSLGDVHSWAPGLINWLSKHNLNTVRISGQLLDSSSNSMNSFFPDPMHRDREKLPLPPIGLDAHPLRSPDVCTPFHHIIVEPGNPSSMVFLLGDLIDRGDHGELTLEIVRQSILANPGSRWTLIGNHEQYVIEDRYNRWRNDERSSIYDGKDGKLGTIYHHPIVASGILDGELESMMKLNFDVLQGSLGALLLTQHLVLFDNLTGSAGERYRLHSTDSMEKIGIDLESIRSEVIAGSWKLHSLGRKFLEKIRKISNKEEIVIPGSIAVSLFEGSFMMHADPSKIGEFPSHVWDDLDCFVQNENFSISPARIFKGKIIGEQEILWSRGWWSNNGQLSGLDHLNRLSVHSILHGHENGKGECRRKTVGGKNPIEVLNLDEGMTPVYRYNYLENPLFSSDPNFIPIGYRRELV